MELIVKRALLKRLPVPEQAPKRPGSAYMLFAKEKGQALFASNEALPAKEKLSKVGSTLGAAWKALSESERVVRNGRDFFTKLLWGSFWCLMLGVRGDCSKEQRGIQDGFK